MRKTIGAPLVVLLALLFAASHAEAREECGVTEFDGTLFGTSAAVVAETDGTSCDTALRIASGWHEDLADHAIDQMNLEGERFYPGGPYRFAVTYWVEDFACRQRNVRRNGYDANINEVWCRSRTSGEIVGWRSVMAQNRSPAYPTLGPDELRPRIRAPTLTYTQAHRYLREGLTREFDEAFTSGYGRRFACKRATRLSFRCRPSWIIGDGFYSGTAWVKRWREGFDVLWDYGWRITMTDELCAHLRRGNCRRVYEVN